jgi:hypothetical protein
MDGFQLSVRVFIGQACTASEMWALRVTSAGQGFLPNDYRPPPIDGRTLGPAEGAHWAK